MVLNIKCPGCGNLTELNIDDEAYMKYKSGEVVAQRAFPNLNSFEREALISGYCFDCTSKIFNTPKPGEDWGKVLGECPVCGCTAYERNVDGNFYKCPSCGVKCPTEDITVEEDYYE